MFGQVLREGNRKFVKLDQLTIRWPEFQERLGKRELVRRHVSTKQNNAPPLVFQRRWSGRKHAAHWPSKNPCRDGVSDTTAWVFDVSVSAGNQMDVAMKYGLSGNQSAIHAKLSVRLRVPFQGLPCEGRGVRIAGSEFICRQSEEIGNVPFRYYQGVRRGNREAVSDGVGEFVVRNDSLLRDGAESRQPLGLSGMLGQLLEAEKSIFSRIAGHWCGRIMDWLIRMLDGCFCGSAMSAQGRVRL